MEGARSFGCRFGAWTYLGDSVCGGGVVVRVAVAEGTGCRRHLGVDAGWSPVEVETVDPGVEDGALVGS